MLSLRTIVRTQVVDPLLSLTFPPLCMACGASLQNHHQRLCAHCGELLDAARIAPGALRALRASRGPHGALDHLLVLYYFDRDSPLQRLIHTLKYRGGRSVGRELGVELGKLLRADLRGPSPAALVPVPLHPARFRERGYNQARLVADGIRSIIPIPIRDELLVRRRFTPSQTGQSADARRGNVAGAFALRPGAELMVRDKTLLLVDDVVTTGATFAACAEELKSAGASKCTGVAVALARWEERVS
jgi:ComF family protein